MDLINVAMTMYFFTLFPLTPFSQRRRGKSKFLTYNEIAPLPRERGWGEGKYI
jgi:hypothetical protein